MLNLYLDTSNIPEGSENIGEEFFINFDTTEHHQKYTPISEEPERHLDEIKEVDEHLILSDVKNKEFNVHEVKQVEIDKFEVIENQLDHSHSSSEMPEIVNAAEASEIIIEDNIANDEEITKEEIKETQTIEESSEKYANSPQNIGNENIDIPENKEIDFDQDTFALDSNKKL